MPPAVARHTLELLICFQGSFAGLGVLNEGLGVIPAKMDTGSVQIGGFGRPRLLGPLVGQSAQLGYPAADILVLRVEFAAVQNRIEDSEVRGGVGPTVR